MTLYHYLHPIENAGIDPSLLRFVPPSMLTKVSKEVKKAEGRQKKCGTYLTVTVEAKVRVATYRRINALK